MYENSRGLLPTIATMSAGYYVLGTCNNSATFTKPTTDICNSSITLRGIGVNTYYYLGDTTNFNRSTVVTIDTSALTTAGDTNIVDIFGGYFSTHVITNTNKVYA
jgi:hypothetical protein